MSGRLAQPVTRVRERQRADTSGDFIPGILRLKGVRVQSAVGRGRSRPIIVEANDGRNYVVKLRASDKTTRRLIAEVICWSIASVARIPQPPVALIEVDETVDGFETLPEEKGTELQESRGLVFGSLHLPDTLSLRRGADPPMTAAQAATIVWFDALVINADRKWRNPNILTKAGEFWVIDNDSAFHLHHRWAEPERRSPFSMSPVSGTTWWTRNDNVLLPWASSITEAGDAMAQVIDDHVIDEAVRAVPSSWFADGFPQGCIMEPADAYREFLWNRLRLRRDFEEQADVARVHGTCFERA